MIWDEILNINIENIAENELSLLYRKLGLKMADIYKLIGIKTTNKKPDWFKRVMDIPSFHRDFNDFADHTDFLENGAVIVEPYYRNIDDFDNFISICKAEELEFMVSGKNYHFPGHCFQVKIAPLTLGETIYGVD